MMICTGPTSITLNERRAVAHFLGRDDAATREEMRAFLHMHGTRGLAEQLQRWLTRGQSLPLPLSQKAATT